MRILTQRVFVAGIVLVVVMLAGCGQQSSELAEGLASASSESSSIDLVPLTLDQWHAEIAGFEGKIVVSDMWATWCIPCIEKFPHMVELSHRYADRGVQFISTSLDDPTDNEAIAYAREFLVEQHATFPNYLINENITDTFEGLDLMSIPAVFIYGRDGELRYRLTADDPNNQFTDQDVEDAIEGLLAEGSA